MDRPWVEATFEAIGRFGKGERGFNRLVFSDADWAACDHFAGLMRQAGLVVRTDAWGNLIGRLDGTEPARRRWRPGRTSTRCPRAETTTAASGAWPVSAR